MASSLSRGIFFEHRAQRPYFLILDSGKGGFDELEPAKLLRSQGFQCLAVYVVRGDVRKILRIHVFNDCSKILALRGEVFQDLLLQVEQRGFHFFKKRCFHYGTL